MVVEVTRDPDALAAEAAELLAPPLSGLGFATEEAVRRACKPILTDLFQLEQKLQENAELSLPAFFGAQIIQKVAGLLFLTRLLLRYSGSHVEPSQDLQEARKLLTVILQALFQLQSVDGLIWLYDYTIQHESAPNAAFWEGISLHLLYMLSLLHEARPQVLCFLRERKEARRQVERLVTMPDTQRAAVVRAVGEEYLRAKQQGFPPVPEHHVPYLTIVEQFDPEPPTDQTAEIAVLQLARERIRQAVERQDIAGLVRWAAEGSPAAAQAVLRSVKSNMTPSQYQAVLAGIMRHPQAPPVRLAAAVQELGQLSRLTNIQGGDPNILPLLREMAMTDIPERAGAARLAAREFAACDAFNESLNLLEYAVMLEVAEEAMLHLRDSRRLAMVERIVQVRPILQPAYDAAFAHVQKAKSLMESVWSAQSDDLAMMYLNRLKEMKAFPELMTLCQKRTKISDLANKTLADLKMSMSAYVDE